jgi:hypothetical protein
MLAGGAGAAYSRAKAALNRAAVSKQKHSYINYLLGKSETLARPKKPSHICFCAGR